FCCWFFWTWFLTVAAAEADPQPVKGKPGEKVTLDFGDQKLKEADWVVWSRGPDSAVLAQYIDRDLFILSRRFQLDTETGSLTILDLRVNDTGTYQGQNLNGNTTRRRFHLTVDGEETKIYFEFSEVSAFC
uniref:Immunoglobulin V-set domain-containing protein n=1 Tax=Poecilia reticulata TaxID=8081 RepID=A0A3P9N5S7_POERE